jgi:EF hand
MKKRSLRTATLATAIGLGSAVAFSVMAQPPGPMGFRHPPRMARGLMALDTNNDGKISKDEYMAGCEQRFTRLDRNGDGYIEPDELPGRMHRMPPPGAMPPPRAVPPPGAMPPAPGAAPAQPPAAQPEPAPAQPGSAPAPQQ